MINFQLAKEIYGLTPWMMDTYSIPVMSAILSDLKNGVQFEPVEVKLNTPYLYNPENETRVIARPYGNGWDPGQLDNNDDFDAIGLINLNGPITKSGGASSIGMEQLSNMMTQMSIDKRVKSFVILTDSGGGSSSAVQLMVDTINSIKKTKPVYALITKGGMAASAAYGIISAATKIYSEAGLNVVGSIGTMIQFEGREANTETKDGVKHIRLYATKSTKKNEAFEEALNNDNYKLLKSELLDPINEDFIKNIAANRPQLKGVVYDDGATHFSRDVIGTFIDGIASFSEVIAMAESGGNYRDKKKVNINKLDNNHNKTTMTKAEFKTASPAAYSEIVNEGVISERDRVATWMAHNETDPESVSKGIESGEQLTSSKREEFFVKQNAKNSLKKIKTESTPPIVTPASGPAPVVPKTEDELELDQAFKFTLK
jgi:ClpP class serine protease